jgi:multimeric flavodoxin WrbA
MEIIFNGVDKADCIIFATPIYSWYCTPPMKAVLDRLVYGMNKYYGDIEGDALWKGKKCAIVTTCGYDLDWGSGVFEEGIKRYAKHSKLEYLGKIAVRDIDGKSYFQNEEAAKLAVTFAHKVYNAI